MDARLPALLTTAVLLLGGGASAASTRSAADGPRVTHGVVVGDVTDTSAVLWARADRAATLDVAVTGSAHARIDPVAVEAGHDFTGHVLLTGLRPATRYHYRVSFTAGGAHGDAVEGAFSTAPPDSTAAPVRLAFGGDVSGQNVCRDAAEGFPIAQTIRAWHPDVFVGLGDMIYADDTCGPTGRYLNAQVPGGFGPSIDLPGFWAHWRYNRADPGLQHLLASTDYVGVWDDHEVVNDFGPLTDTRSTPPYTPGVHLMPLGLQAFVDWTPIAIAANTPNRLYRDLRWGKSLELIALDNRQYRDANDAVDSESRPKTMLGREQLTWLKERLSDSDATWKAIVSSVPMSIPTGFPAANGRDGWANFDQATGFENELRDIVRFLHEEGIRNVVWITTDVHFGEVFRYTPFPDDPGFRLHEVVVGPLNSGIFPTREFDTTLNPERLFFFGPDRPEDVVTWEQAKRFFNFGTLEIDAHGTLTIGIVDTAGDRVFSLPLAPAG
jgi:alkaline phosphatase D